MYCTPEITVTALKQHRCTWCGQTIEPGTTYTRWMNRDEDGVFMNKVHRECMEPLWMECRDDMGVYVPFDNERGRATVGCHECAWGKVAGCWRCGSR